jgi:hypothetical protein
MKFRDGSFQEDYTHYLILHKYVHSKKEINTSFCVGFEVLTAASMKMDVFWVVAPCTQ